MSAFPETSMTLLKKLAVQVTGEREAAWVCFFGLYEPAIKRFVAWHDSSHDPDDVVQDIFLKLVSVVQSGGYDSGDDDSAASCFVISKRPGARCGFACGY